MQIIHTVLITLSIALVIVNCHSADLEENHNIETSLDAKIVDKEVGDQNNKENNQASDRLGETVPNNTTNNNSIDLKDKDSSKVFGLNETGNEKKETDSDKAGDSTEKANNSSYGKIEQRTIEPERKVGLGEECDSSSNSCEIVDKGLIACLRVPGNESPDLSLLIQNKGKGMATVTISAPAYVQLETNQIEVPEKENKKVKVSIGNKGTGSVMVLKSGNGNCSLDFKELINEETLKYISTSQIAIINFSNSTSILWFIVLVAFLVIALLGTFISLWRKRKLSGIDNKSKYENLEMGSPVSYGRSKKISDSNDGWDDNWDDSWDDLEAPKASFVSVNSSISQDVIAAAPRRSNKEGWKD